MGKSVGLIQAIAMASLAAVVPANAQDAGGGTLQVATVGEEPTPVIFQYGRGVDERSITAISTLAFEEGCSVSSDNSGRPRRITVRFGDENHSFTHADSALAWALERCVPDPQVK